MLIVAVYIPPGGNIKEALSELYKTISNLQTAHPDRFFIVARDFNHANLKSLLLKFQQHIDFATHGTHTLDHISVMLFPAYRPLLKRAKWVLKQVRTWRSGLLWAHRLEYVQRGCYISQHHRLGGMHSISDWLHQQMHWWCNFLQDHHYTWMTAEAWLLLKTQDSAFRSDDKAALHTVRADNIPGRVLRECADQLADVHTDLFNISMSKAVVPVCFKTTTIIPGSKKSSVPCLNDCCTHISHHEVLWVASHETHKEQSSLHTGSISIHIPFQPLKGGPHICYHASVSGSSRQKG